MPGLTEPALQTTIPGFELTDRLDLSAWPEGTRLIVRRERPHPGAQFQVFDAHGYRHTAFITDQDDTDIAALELRHLAPGRGPRRWRRRSLGCGRCRLR